MHALKHLFVLVHVASYRYHTCLPNPQVATIELQEQRKFMRVSWSTLSENVNLREEHGKFIQTEQLAVISFMTAPIFSKDWSSKYQEGALSSKPQRTRAVSTSFFRNLHKEDFPLPVGIQMAIHKITGSSQSVPSTTTHEWDMLKLMIISTPASTATGGMLIAVPTCLQACSKSVMNYVANY